MPSVAEFREAIAAYQSLIAQYTLARERMIGRRKGASDHVMVELDERIEYHTRTIRSLHNALEVTREHLKLAERETGAG
jgi:hypothetical protein